MNPHDCDYELKEKIFTKIQNKTLLDVFENFQRDSTSYSQRAILGTEDIQIFSNKDILNNNFFQRMKNSKLGKIEKNLKDNSFSKKLFLNFNLMKSVLGHISTNSIEDNNIISVPIYCISFSNDNDMIFTGDNNG